MASKKLKKQESFDFVFLTIVIILVLIGTIMIISSSAAYSYYKLEGDTYHFFKKQVIWIILGALATIIMFKIDIYFIKKVSVFLYLFSIILLVLVLIPGIGLELNDARRWISIRDQTLQPSELFKFALIVFLANRLSWKKHEVNSFKNFAIYLLLIGVPIFLLIEEPHISASIIITTVSLAILFYAGAKIWYFIIPMIIGIPAVGFIVYQKGYALSRILTFLNPERDPQGKSLQILQSLYAITSGGLFGKGLGRSLRKYLYIPEPYNDFIFSVYTEELGFLGAIILIALFAMFMIKGMNLAKSIDDEFISYSVFGIVFLIILQTILNIAVVTSSIPVTGMPLPFFSYGGTSFVVLMGEIGFILNASQYRKVRRIGQ